MRVFLIAITTIIHNTLFTHLIFKALKLHTTSETQGGTTLSTDDLLPTVSETIFAM
jgi:hypothetical protein